MEKKKEKERKTFNKLPEKPEKSEKPEKPKYLLVSLPSLLRSATALHTGVKVIIQIVMNFLQQYPFLPLLNNRQLQLQPQPQDSLHDCSSHRRYSPS